MCACICDAGGDDGGDDGAGGDDGNGGGGAGGDDGGDGDAGGDGGNGDNSDGDGDGGVDLPGEPHPARDTSGDGNTLLNNDEICSHIRNLGDSLERQCKGEFTVLGTLAIKSVRVPLLKLKHCESSIAIDVTVGHVEMENIFS